jgi:hypothetical protein
MMRVDGRARFLDCPPSTDAQMDEYMDLMIKDEGSARRSRRRGSVDLAYPCPTGRRGSA